MNTVTGTFSDFARSVFSRLLSSGGKAAIVSEAPQRIDFVCDQYFDHSIKNAERKQRAQAACSEPLRMMSLRPDQETRRQWNRYLSDSQNKTDLLTFLHDHWQSDPYFASELGLGRTLFVTSGEVCTRLTATVAPDGSSFFMKSNSIKQLACTHEEADTRLLLHAAHAATSGYTTVVIHSPDTDVAILACAAVPDIQAQLLFRTGTRQRARYRHQRHGQQSGPLVCAQHCLACMPSQAAIQPVCSPEKERKLDCS